MACEAEVGHHRPGNALSTVANDFLGGDDKHDLPAAAIRDFTQRNEPLRDAEKN